VLGTISLKNGNDIHEFIKLRSIFLKSKYTGPWNENDQKWSTNIKNLLFQTDKSNDWDNVFLISLQDFKSAF